MARHKWMTSTRLLGLLLVGSVLLTACSQVNTPPPSPASSPTLTPVASPTRPPSPTVGPTETPSPTLTPTPLALPPDYPTQAEGVVSLFLQSLMDDPGGGGSLVYLDPSLQLEAQRGRSVLHILGLPGIYRAFTPGQAGPDIGGAVTFHVTLDFEDGPQARVFILKQQGNAWRISAVAAGEYLTVTPVPTPPELSDPGQVVQNFLLSLLKDPSGESSLGYLSSRLAAQVRGGRSLTTVIGLQTMYHTFSYEVLSPGVIRVTLSADTGVQVCTFSLIQEGGWRIDTITSS